MKKIFLFAAAALMSITASAQTIEVFALDSVKGATMNIVPGKSGDGPEIAAGTKFYAGTAFDVTLPFATKMAVVSATQPNGAHKSVQIGNEVISMTYGIQGNDNPKDVNTGNPCNTLLEPAQGALWQVNPKADGWVVVLHKASSNKQYFVFENGSALGYQFGMMTYADKTLGNNGLMQYELVGDEELNYLDSTILETTTGFKNIAWVEDYFNDTTTSGIAWETYKQNGVSAIAFKAYEGETYLVGAAGSKISAAAIVFVSGLNGELPIIAKGETITEEGKDPVTYADVELLKIAGETQGIEDVNDAVKAVKRIENGQLYIYKNNVKYNVLGTVAK